MVRKFRFYGTTRSGYQPEWWTPIPYGEMGIAILNSMTSRERGATPGKGSHALGKVAQNNADNEIKIASLGGIETIIKAMNNSAVMQEYGSKALLAIGWSKTAGFLL